MGRVGVTLGALALAALPFAGSGAAQGAATGLSQPQRQALPSLSALVERVMPAVVNISVVMHPSENDEASDELLRRLLPDAAGSAHPPPRRRNVTALGSGFVIDPAGFIVTNGHLIEGAERITVITHDNVRHTAQVVGRDDQSDIAVLRIAAPAPMQALRWADSDKARVGDWVVAVGNPFGLGGTVTAGIISARGRDLDDGPYDDFLQIDAPINRGNSGGPTFDLDGEVLGINTAIYTPTGGSIGIGFAIPSSFARRIVQQIMSRGTVEHGWLGVSTQNVTPSIAQSFGIDPADPAGALIDDVVPGSPASQAGLRQGDVILAVNGETVSEPHDLRRLVDQAVIGRAVTLAVRRDGRDRRIDTMVGAEPGRAAIAAAAPETEGEGSSEPPPPPTLGLDLNSLTPDLRRRLELPRSTDGVYVASVSAGSAASTLGLEPGDIIVSVSRRKVATPAEVRTRLDDAIAEGQVLVLVNRHGASRFLGATRDRDRLVETP